MADSNHKLYLGMYSFQIKKRNTRNTEAVKINDFLSEAYPAVEKKFVEGFAKDIIDLFEKKTYKNKSNTHGGILEDKSIAGENRYFDIMIDGGLTGIKQFLVDEDGTKQTITKDKVVALKFYARFWMPAGNKTGFVFIQKYGSLSIKPLFDDIIKSTLKNHGYSVAGTASGLKAITTEKRLKIFLKSSSIRDVTVISKKSKHDSGTGDAQTVSIKVKNIVTKKKDKSIDRKVVIDALKNHGLSLGNNDYEMTATYESKFDGKKDEEKTVKLEADTEDISIIPNIPIPSKYIDVDNYPIFKEMRKFVDNEIVQIKKESKE